MEPSVFDPLKFYCNKNFCVHISSVLLKIIFSVQKEQNSDSIFYFPTDSEPVFHQ